MAAKKSSKTASKKTTKTTKRASKVAKKPVAKKRASKKAKGEPPGVSQSGKSAGGAPPFATKDGAPTVTDGANATAATPSGGVGVDVGGGQWDIDQTQTPIGGVTLRADPSPQAVSQRGAVGNPGTPSVQSPFKTLK